MNGPVICGVDGSNSSDGAMDVARELAERYGLPVVYAHVLDGGADGEDAARILHDDAARRLSALEFEHGHPADRLVELARDRDASFLVVGNHGPRSSLLGSVSADVARRASCPVVVVPPTVRDAS